MDNIIRKPYEFFLSSNSGEIIRLVSTDVANVFEDVATHRLILSTKSKSAGKNMNMVIKDILNAVPVKKTPRER